MSSTSSRRSFTHLVGRYIPCAYQRWAQSALEPLRSQKTASKVQSWFSRLFSWTQRRWCATSSSPSQEKDTRPTVIPIHRQPLVSERGIFVNAEMSLGDIDVIGFDYDYTLSEYTEDTQPLLYNMAKRRLIEAYSYPQELSRYEYDPTFAIRGLHFDTQRGFLMKLDSRYNIQEGSLFFGRRPVGRSELVKVYGHDLQLRRSYFNAYLRGLSDIFCLPEACTSHHYCELLLSTHSCATGLISDVIQHFVTNDINFDPSLVYEDVTRAVSSVHYSGAFHREIMNDLSRYLLKKPQLAEFLLRLRAAGKTTFLLTNSRFPFVDAGLKFLINEHLPRGYSDWRELFDIVITSARKPEWFTSEHPFRVLDLRTGGMVWSRIHEFRPGEVYVEGSLHDFRRISGKKGYQVIYFGDHILTDLREPSLIEGWKTGVIIRELETEIKIQNSPQYWKCLQSLLKVEREIREKQCEEDLPHGLMQYLLVQRNQLRLELKNFFNMNFGSSFRTNTHATLFASYIQQFAYVYTSRIENFLAYPIDYTFYPFRRYLPHEVQMVHLA